MTKTRDEWEGIKSNSQTTGEVQRLEKEKDKRKKSTSTSKES